MSFPQLVWVVVIESPAGALVPLGLSEDEERAKALANDALETIALGLSYHATAEMIAETDRRLDSIEVRRAWLLIEEKPTEGVPHDV